MAAKKISQIKVSASMDERFLASALLPNALTRDTMEKSARGEEVHQAKNATELFAKLGIS